MKRLLALAAFAVFGSGCQRVDRQPPDEYRNPIDQWIVRLGLPNVGIWPCRKNDAFDQCFRLQPSKRWHGTWVLGPAEHDERFCPDEMGKCLADGDLYSLYWRASVGRVPREPSGQGFYTVDFEGRRSTYAHDLPNQHRFVIVADRLISMEKARPKMPDTEFEAFRASNPGMSQRCLNENRYVGMPAWQPDDPDCFEMLPPQRWSGLWEIGWEWTNFCPAPAKECDWMLDDGTWLTFAKGVRLKADIPWGTYRIEFVGRRTKVPGSFGHTGAYKHLMVVDRLISVQKIPGEQYTKR